MTEKGKQEENIAKELREISSLLRQLLTIEKFKVGKTLNEMVYANQKHDDTYKKLVQERNNELVGIQEAMERLENIEEE